MPVEFTITQPGPLAFPVTPFHEDGTLDLRTFGSHLRRLLDHHPPALFVACGTGEFASLDVDEVGQLVRAAVEIAGPGVPIYAGVGQGLPLARRFARAAEEAGAYGLLALPPYLVAGEQEGLINYYLDLSASTSLGLILYQRDNAVFEPETVARLADVPNIVGFKDGLGDIERMQRVIATVGGMVTYFNGMPTAETFQPAYVSLGVPHYSSAVFNFAPEISWAFYQAVTEEDAQSVHRLLQEFFIPLTNLRRQVKGYAVALVKAGVGIRWGAVGPVRAPLVDVRPAHMEMLREVVARGLAVVNAA